MLLLLNIACWPTCNIRHPICCWLVHVVSYLTASVILTSLRVTLLQVQSSNLHSSSTGGRAKDGQLQTPWKHLRKNRNYTHMLMAVSYLHDTLIHLLYPSILSEVLGLCLLQVKVGNHAGHAVIRRPSRASHEAPSLPPLYTGDCSTQTPGGLNDTCSRDGHKPTG